MNEAIRIGVLASGNGTNLQTIIDRIEAGALNATIACVISNKSDAFALERARRHNIPAIHLDHRQYDSREAYDSQLADTLRKQSVKLVVLAGYMRIVTPSLLNAFPQAVINIHPALLPSFPGLHAQRQALDHGVRVTGCTVHFVDAGVDTGPIIVQAAVPVLTGDTEETLSKRIQVEEHRLFPLAIELISAGRVQISGRQVKITPPLPPSCNSLENPSAA
jgi:phosphoribosylglycinamide formyltransferase-1